MPKACVVTADQISSRSRGDRVPEALRVLSGLPTMSPKGRARRFARTAGDEIQALFEVPAEVIDAVEALQHLGGWRIGVGVGEVTTPVPDDVRAASGGAFIAAREAVEASGRVASRVAVRADDGQAQDACARVEAACALLSLAWGRRRETSWEVARFAEQNMPQHEMANRLGITPSAVSQRIASGAVEEVLAGKRLAAWLLDDALRL